jgi:hypothetical protein
MRVLGPIIPPQSLLMRTGQAKVPKSRAVRTQLVGYQQFRSEAQFLEQLAHQPQRRAFVALALDQHIEDLAFVVDGAPQVHPPAGDPNHHLVEMPSVARARPALPQPAGDQGTKFQHQRRTVS